MTERTAKTNARSPHQEQRKLYCAKHHRVSLYKINGHNLCDSTFVKMGREAAWILFLGDCLTVDSKYVTVESTNNHCLYLQNVSRKILNLHPTLCTVCFEGRMEVRG